MSNSAMKYHEPSSSDDQEKRRGRPRSETSKKSILNAVNRLLLLTSVKDLSIEAIAKKAGVGKTTIYRWWPNKVAVVLDALLYQLGNTPALPTSATKAEAITNQLERFMRLLKGKNGKILIEVMAEAQANEETLANLIEDGKENGEFRKEISTALAVDMIYGSIVYRLMSGAETLDQDFTTNLPLEALNILQK